MGLLLPSGRARRKARGHIKSGELGFSLRGVVKGLLAIELKAIVEYSA